MGVLDLVVEVSDDELKYLGLDFTGDMHCKRGGSTMKINGIPPPHLPTSDHPD